MTALFHITHVQNLPGIVAAGGLWCDSTRAARVAAGAEVVGIAHQHIKDRRAQKAVIVAAGGTLADYVPFYFAPRSPMLFTISRGNVEGYTGGQEQVVHLVSCVETVCRLGAPWCFTDGHADMALSRQYTDVNDLSKVDWAVMRDQYWTDTIKDGDRKRRRQAEFLVHGMFPWTAVEEIAVMSERMAAAVRAGIAGAGHLPRVVVRAEWYY